MKCPNCRSADSAVIDSRSRNHETVRWRKHECKRCGCKYETFEIPASRYKQMEKLESKERERLQRIVRETHGS